MKLSVITLLALPAMAAAFVPAQPRAFFSSLAVTKEEDLELTRQVIADHIDISGGEAPAPAAEEAPAPAPVEEE
jgi:hypothetical protein